MRLRNKENGFSLIELVIVCAIIAFISATVVWPFYMNYVGKRNVNGGITRLLTIKKGIERVGLECAGRPKRANAAGITELKRIWDPKTAGDITLYPKSNSCDSAGLQDFLSTDVGIGATPHAACSFGSGLQACMASSSAPPGMNNVFVNMTAGPCSFGGGSGPGWDYVLVEAVVTVGSDSQPESVPVYCANIMGARGRVVTVVVNGPGLIGTAANQHADDGTGMIAPDGNALPNQCPCNAWCREADSSGGVKQQGCCRACTSADKVYHAGIGYGN